MTIDAARIIIDKRLKRFLGRNRRREVKRSHGARHDDDLFRAASEKLLLQEPPNDDDLNKLMPLALHGKYEWYVFTGGIDPLAAYRRSIKVRRKLFLESIRRNARRKPENRIDYHIFVLTPDDVEWLMQHIVRIAAKDDSVWEELLRISRGAPRRLKQRARDLVRQHRPDIVKLSDKKCREYRQTEQRHKNRRESEAKRRENKHIQIKDAVQELLGSNKLSLQQKMRRLSWICFGDDQQRPRDVTGTWDDLPSSLKDDVLDICQKALETCDPTPIPDGSTFSSSILYEAWCFRDVMLKRPDCLELTSELIGKWLPSMFVFHVEREEEVIAACYLANREAAERVFLDAIKRDLRNESEYMSRTENLDDEYWSPRLATEVAELIVDAQYAEKPRASLLSILAKRSPGTADKLLRETLKSSASIVMRNAALDSLLRIDVNAAWPYIQADYEERGKAALLNLSSLYDYHRNRISIETPEWTAERLLELTRMLHASFPPDQDPEYDGHITPEHDFSEIRGSIPRFLFQRNSEGDHDALEQLVCEQPHLKNWYDQAKAQERAKGELACATLSTPDGSSHIKPPSYEKIVKLLKNADYRIVRNEDDLLDVVEEELRKIGSEAGRYIEMLYLPKEIAKGTKRRHESALQSYIECRLTDRLPGRILDAATTISIHRERQACFRERTDIEINVPLLHSGLGRVVIEVKWSDNDAKRRNISTALVKQLGNRYLLADGRTHGIYLVGWNGCLGKWRREAGKRPKKPLTPQALEDALQRQSQEYMDAHDGIRISPIVIDITWPDD